MKRVLILVAVLTLISTPAFSATLTSALSDFSLSNNVVGAYFANDAQSQYVVYTANSQGDKMYAGGSFVSEIYEKDGYASGDLPSSDPSYDSSAFNNYSKR